MKTFLEHKLLSLRQNMATIHLTLGDNLLRMRELCYLGKICLSVENLHAIVPEVLEN